MLLSGCIDLVELAAETASALALQWLMQFLETATWGDWSDPEFATNLATLAAFVVALFGIKLVDAICAAHDTAIPAKMSLDVK